MSVGHDMNNTENNDPMATHDDDVVTHKKQHHLIWKTTLIVLGASVTVAAFNTAAPYFKTVGDLAEDGLDTIAHVGGEIMKGNITSLFEDNREDRAPAQFGAYKSKSHATELANTYSEEASEEFYVASTGQLWAVRGNVTCDTAKAVAQLQNEDYSCQELRIFAQK